MTAAQSARRASATDLTLVPRFLTKSLVAMLVAVGVVSVPFIGRFAPVPVADLIDVWILLFILAAFLRGPLRTTFLLGIVSAYALTRIIPALATESPMMDFLQAYKWLLYLFAFAFAVGRHWGSMVGLVRLTWISISLALVKSVLTFVILGPGERPGLFTENNFEIALFAGLVIVTYPHLARRRLLLIFLLGVLTVLSESRSGAVAFLIVAIYAMLSARQSGLFARYLMVCTIPLLAYIPYVIFAERSAGVGRVDRLRFFDGLMAETSSWGALDWFFGTVPLTALSNASCSTLAYYQRLFSSVGDGTCYSVILHAFNMRVVFDAGVLGLVLAYGVVWYTMTRAGVQLTVKLALLAIAITNGLSVSGLNNPYVALPIVLAICCAPEVARIASMGGRDRADARSRALEVSGRASRLAPDSHTAP